MFTSKDIEMRTIFVLNCIEEKSLRVSSGELLLENVETDKTLTKMPFQKILAIFVIGHISITTPLIEKCKQFNVALVVMKPNLRPVYYWANSAEANFLLRRRQHLMEQDDISIARVLVRNKIKNQFTLLTHTRKKDRLTEDAKEQCRQSLEQVEFTNRYQDLLGIEGMTAKKYFSAYFQELSWTSRKARTKIDPLNATLDIGYTILFNFIEAFIRMFGFDLYVGVYHRLWFKRKSLVCDLMEPFRCIIDSQVRKSFNLSQFSKDDFKVEKGEYILKLEKNSEYCKVFYNALIPYKTTIFKFIQSYYRCFMRNSLPNNYPLFEV